MTKTLVKSCLLALLTSFATASMADTVQVAKPAMIKLSAVSGDVLVNNGARYVKVSANTTVKPGTKIVTNKNSSANLVYANGCVKSVKANSILTVGNVQECVAGKFTNEKIHVAAINVDTVERTQESETDYRRFALFTIAGAGAIWAIAEATDGDGGRKEISPSVSQ